MKPSGILIVEDERIVSREIFLRLQSLGYEPTGRAATGEQALAMAEKQRPDLVLMDIRLQGEMDGIAAACALRARFHIPVVFLTAYSEDDTLERAKLAEPYGYLLKPFDDRELKSTIEIALYKHKAEEEIRRLNRLYDVLSQVNQTIVRIESHEELLATVCRLVVERGKIDLAWIGRLDPDSLRLEPMAWFGERCELLDGAELYADDRPEGHGNPGRAILSGKPSICNECGKSSSCLYPSERSPSQFGFESCGSFPLLFQGEAWGALNICASERGFFREREIELLKEVAMDISFALDKIEGNRQRERAQEALLESELRWQFAIEGAGDGLWDWNVESGELFLSKQWKTMLGYEDHEIENSLDEWKKRIHPEDRERVHADVASHLEGGAPVYINEHRLLCKDGSYKWILDRGKVISRTIDGSPLRVIGMHSDISERKKAEEALRLWADAFEHCAHGIAIGIPATNRIRACNPSFAAMHGRTVEEISNSPILDLYAPSERKRVFDFIMEADRVGKIRYETSMARKDGSTFPVQMDLVSVRDDQGSLLYRVATMQDITERKQAVECLRQSEERYRSLLETSSDWVWEVDAHGQYTYASPQVRDILGYSPDEMIGRSPFDFMPEEEALRLRKVFAGIVAERKPFSLLENVKLRRDGRQAVLESSGSAVYGPNGELIGYRGMDRDITERKRAAEEQERLEAQLLHTQKLEAIGALAGGIAHDFNNILSPIIGYTEMALDDIPESSPAKYELNQVLTAAGRAKELVKQILSFSRLGGQKLMKPVDISLIVKEAVKLLRASLPSSIEIKQNIHQAKAVADPTQIHQVVVNLFTNAAHAMEDKGTIDITLVETTLSAEDLSMLSIADLKPGRYVRLTVKDTGSGMLEATRRRIFEPYFTTKEVGKGTGLGLAVVHGIVKKHAGEIRVESELGKGSSFEIIIPAAEEEAKIESPESTVLPKGNERILLVDDEPLVGESGTRLLGRLGYRVTARSDSMEALSLFRSKPYDFDLVITDYTMPKMLGTDLAKEIMQVRPDIGVILCTGFSERINEESAKEMGIKGFAMKPLDRKELAQLVRKVLDAQ